MSSKIENIFRINRKSLFATLGGSEIPGAFFLGYTWIWSTVNIIVNKVYHYHCLQTKQSLCSMYNKQKALQKKLSHWVRFFVVWVMDERFILKPTSVKIFFCSRGSKLRGNFDANFKIHLNAGTFNYIKFLFKSKTICSLSSKIQTKMFFFI